MEKYKVTFTYVKMVGVADTETQERTMCVNVGIKPSDPYTEVFDRAYEKLCEKVGDCEVLDHRIQDM